MSLAKPVKRVFIESLEGRTITRAAKYGNERLSLLLDDGSVYSEAGYYQGEACLDEHDQPDEMEWIYVLTQLGVMTEEEKHQADETRKARRLAEGVENERAIYERLKQIYGEKP